MINLFCTAEATSTIYRGDVSMPLVPPPTAHSTIAAASWTCPHLSTRHFRTVAGHEIGMARSFLSVAKTFITSRSPLAVISEVPAYLTPNPFGLPTQHIGIWTRRKRPLLAECVSERESTFTNASQLKMTSDGDLSSPSVLIRYSLTSWRSQTLSAGRAAAA